MGLLRKSERNIFFAARVEDVDVSQNEHQSVLWVLCTNAVTTPGVWTRTLMCSFQAIERTIKYWWRASSTSKQDSCFSVLKSQVTRTSAGRRNPITCFVGE